MADTPPSDSHRSSGQRPPVIPPKILWAFVLVTSLFALWGFANDITNPMVAAFKNILLISNFESSLVQFAFYGGYCVMAIPAALFIKRFSYKSGILTGLLLYTVGCLLFIPAGSMMAFSAFLIAYFIMTCGLSFLETSSNPYILAMGPEDTATRRLNLAQSFNPIGSLMGMSVAMFLILASLYPMTEPGRRVLDGVAAGRTCHQQVIDAAITALDGAADSGSLAGIKGARTHLVRIDPEWTAKSTQAIQSLSEAAEGKGAERKKALAAAQDEIGKTFEGQDAFANLRTGEVDLGALDQAALAQEEFEKAPQTLKSALTSARAEAQAVASTLSSLAASESPAAADVKQGAAETLAKLKQASQALQAVDASAVAPLAKAAEERLLNIRKADLDVIIGPYTILGVVVFLVLLVFIFSKLPRSEGEDDKRIDLMATLKRLFANRKYIEGVVAQAFYVGAQIMCWTFIIQYAEAELGMPKPLAQKHNIIAMVMFVSSRFVCTHLLKYFSPGGLLMALAVGGGGLITGTIFVQGMPGLYCLMGVSACMSLMFPTIYGIALKGLGDDAKLGSAGLIMAIGGGSVMPPLQGAILDMDAINLGFMTLSSARASFVLPLICFVVIAIFGFRTSKVHGHKY